MEANYCWLLQSCRFWIETQKLTEFHGQRKAEVVIDYVLYAEVENTLGSEEASRPRRVPVDGGYTTYLKIAPTLEVDEQQSGFRIDLDISQSVEHAVAVVVRDREMVR